MAVCYFQIYVCSILLFIIGTSGLLIGPQRFFNNFKPQEHKNGKVLLVSFDGFRYDYVDRYDTPHFHTLAKVGVHAANGMKPAFLVNTFPNHYTLATGLYEESHGIIDNYFYDPVQNQSFTSSNPSYDPEWWNGGEPIWVTARKRGKRSGTIYWPGSEAEIRGYRPNIYLPFNYSDPIGNRLETALQWLEDDKVDIVCVYYHQPDVVGHKYGAFSQEVAKHVKELDKEVGHLLKSIASRKLVNKVDLIVLSDHGMSNLTSINDNSLIILDNYIDLENDVEMIPQFGPLAGIIPSEGKLEEVYQKLRNAHPHMTVYKKEDFPEKYHYKNNRRVTPIIALADEGYAILPRLKDHDGNVGYHGYDPDSPTMHPIFYATGPSFKKGYTKSTAFENVNIYPLLCHILGIKPSPNNGTLDAVDDMLRSKRPTNFPSFPFL